MDIRERLKQYLEDKEIKAWQINQGVEPNPFPIGKRGVYMLYLGNKLSKNSTALMKLFFIELDELDYECGK